MLKKSVYLFNDDLFQPFKNSQPYFSGDVNISMGDK